VLGMHKTGRDIITFALDRIQRIAPLPEEVFRRQKDFDPHTYFHPIIGVTRNTGEPPVQVVFWANPYHAPYIRTKPIHHTQKIVEETATGTHFSIEVIPNFELERELMGFGEGLKVLSPSRLVRSIQKKVRLMHEMYHPV